MANETLLLRKGLLANLDSAPIVEGALSFTTDEPAIYIDVEGKHLRIGDIKEFADLATLQAYLATTPEKIPTTGLYYAIAENALMKYTGSEWQQINVSYDGSVEDLQAQITAINTALGSKPDGWSDTSIWAAIKKNRDDIAAEKLRAEGVEGGLRTDVDAVRTDLGNKTDAADANGSAFARIAAEKARAESAESGLQQAIEAEKSRAEGVENGLRTDLGNKTDAADANGSAFARIAKNAADIVTVNGEIAKKANATDVYTKTEIDNTVTGINNAKADKATDLAGYGITNAYTKTEVEGLIEDESEVLTGKINAKADKATTLAGYGIGDAYTKTEIDNTVAGIDSAKADKATTLSGYGITNAYTKTEVEGLINNKADALTEEINKKANAATTLEGYGITNAYTKTEIDNTVTGINNAKADKATTLAGYGIADAYTKTEVDKLISDESDALTEEINKKANAATTLEGYGITDAYTKTETETAIDDKIAEVNATNAGLNTRLVAVEGTLAGIGEGETVVGLIDAVAEDASTAASTAESNAKSHADTEIAKEKSRAESAEAGLSQSIGTLRTDMNTLVGVVPEGSDNVIDYINDSQAAQNEAITSAYEAYVDEKLRVADGMSYKGIVNFDDKVLPTSGVQAGDTYKVAVNGKVGSEDVYVGDLIIANSDQSGEDDYADWDIVHSGYEDDHDVHVELNNGVVEIINAAGASRGSIKVEGNYSAANGGVKVTLSSADADPAAPGVEVTAKFEMVWGSF